VESAVAVRPSSNTLSIVDVATKGNGANECAPLGIIMLFNCIRSIASFVAAAALIGFAETSIAAVQLEDAQLVATTPALLQAAPQPQSLVVTTAGTLRVTMSDVGFPAALTSMSLIVVSGSSSVAHLAQAGFVDFDATPGTYLVRVLGTGPSGGTIGVTVAPSAGGTALLQFNAGIAAPGALPTNQSTFSAHVAVTQAANYQVTLTDRIFPSALTSIDMLIVDPSGSPMYRFCAPANASPCTTGVPLTSGPIALNVATYDVFLNVVADTTTMEGLFSADISNASAGSVYSVTLPVGALQSQTEINFPTADQYSFALTDLQYPAALGQLKAIIAQSGSVIGTANGTMTTTVAANAGQASLYTFAVPGASASAGVFGVQVQHGTASLYEDARAVTSTSSTVRAFAFTATLSAAGSYRARLTDFGFPSAIPQLQMVVSQHGAALGNVSNAGTVDVSASAGSAVVVVLANMLSSTTTGLFGVNLTAQPAGTVVFEATQGTGDLFQARTVTATAAGNLDVSVSDLGFPAAFGDLALAVTRGTTMVGQIFGGGKFTFAATPGDYSLNFIARAGSNSNYGLFGTEVADTPPPPVVTLNATPSTVATGGMTNLNWTATGATSCIASGGWNGTQPTSGTASNVGPFTSNSTLTLTCSGPGGSSSANANITIAAEQKSGGGNTSYSTLCALALLMFLRHFRNRGRCASYAGAYDLARE
jgi:hypothetical protein